MVARIWRKHAMELRRSLRAVTASGLALIALLAGSGSAGASTGWTITPVLSGLEGPRGVAYDGHGNLYVSETGKYFNIASGPFGVSRTGSLGMYAMTRVVPSRVTSLNVFDPASTTKVRTLPVLRSLVSRTP